MSFAYERERMERGVRWLNENGPEDWFDRINLEQLEISSAQRCVLGQVYAEASKEPGEYGGYQSGWGWFFDHYDLDAISHGFVGLDLMTNLWREKIIALRVAAAKRHVRALREEELVCV